MPLSFFDSGAGGSRRFMLTFSNTQQLTSAQDLQGSRAYWAARAGLEWGIGSAVAACPASPTSLTIDPFTVVVTCSPQAYTEAGATINILQFTSVARAALDDIDAVRARVIRIDGTVQAGAPKTPVQ